MGTPDDQSQRMVRAPAPEGTSKSNPALDGAPPPTATQPTGGKWWKSQQGLFLLAIVAWVLPLGGILAFPQLNQPVLISLSLGTVALVTFVAFFSATGTEGTRTSIAASLVVFYLVLITHLIAAPGLRNQLDTPTPAAPVAEATPTPEPGETPATDGTETVPVSFGRDIFNGLTEFVKIVLLFYFTAVTAEKAVTTVTAAVQNRATTEAGAKKEVAASEAERARTEFETAQTRLAAAQVEAAHRRPASE